MDRRRKRMRNAGELLLPLIAFGIPGGWLCFRHDDAGVLFLGLTAVLVGLWVVGFIHRRRVPSEGPADPSLVWRSSGLPDQGAHVFAYSRGALWMVWGAFGLSLPAAPLIWLSSNPPPEGLDFIWIGGFVVALNGGFLLAAFACERYRVEVGAEGFVHYRLRSPLHHPFATLGGVALLEGGGRGPKYVLALYDKQGRCVDTFADTLEGFTELVALTKEYASAAGVPYRYRDMWGAWTR